MDIEQILEALTVLNETIRVNSGKSVQMWDGAREVEIEMVAKNSHDVCESANKIILKLIEKLYKWI